MKKKVCICRSYDSYDDVILDINEIWNVRWDNISGGCYRHHAGYALYGYINYELGASLGLCSGRHSYYGNDIKIMIPERRNRDKELKKGYLYLRKSAGQKPACLPTHKKGMPPCTKMILLLLQKKPWMRGELRGKIRALGYTVDFSRAIRALFKQERILLKGSSCSKYQIIALK